VLSERVVQAVARLKKLCPVDYPVKVVVGGSPKDSHSIAEFNGQSFTVRLPKAHSLQLIYLAHEWAHLNSWHMEGEGFYHGYHWGICHSETYRAVFGED